MKLIPAEKWMTRGHDTQLHTEPIILQQHKNSKISQFIKILLASMQLYLFAIKLLSVESLLFMIT